MSEVQPAGQTISDTGLRAPLTFTIQERFMRLRYETYRNVTFTEWNTCSNSPSELHKIVADIFVQGYYDDVHDRITRAVAVDVSLVNWFGETIKRSRTTGNPKNRATHDDPFADYEDPFQDD